MRQRKSIKFKVGLSLFCSELKPVVSRDAYFWGETTVWSKLSWTDGSFYGGTEALAECCFDDGKRQTIFRMDFNEKEIWTHTHRRPLFVWGIPQEFTIIIMLKASFTLSAQDSPKILWPFFIDFFWPRATKSAANYPALERFFGALLPKHLFIPSVGPFGPFIVGPVRFTCSWLVGNKSWELADVYGLLKIWTISTAFEIERTIAVRSSARYISKS